MKFLLTITADQGEDLTKVTVEFEAPTWEAARTVALKTKEQLGIKGTWEVIYAPHVYEVGDTVWVRSNLKGHDEFPGTVYGYDNGWPIIGAKALGSETGTINPSRIRPRRLEE